MDDDDVTGVNVEGVREKVGDCGEWRPGMPGLDRNVSSCGMPPPCRGGFFKHSSFVSHRVIQLNIGIT